MKSFRCLLGGLCACMFFSCTTPATQEVEQKEEGKNAVIENIMTRRSVRKYKPQPVNRDTMQIITECGINAPNAINRQAWEVRIVDNPELINGLIDALAKANPDNPMAKGMFRNAPTLAFIANDTTFQFSPVDCGLLSENMMLSAWSMGIGSVCMAGPVHMMLSSPAAEPFLKKLGFSENYKLLLCIGFGYPDETPAAKPRDKGKVKFID